MAKNTHAGLDPALKYRLYRFSVWCGVIVLIASTVAFFFLGKLFPPPDPSWGTTEITAFFTENRTRIIWSVIMMAFFAPFFYFFAVITTLQIKRIEGELGLLSLVQLTTGVIAPTGWVYPMSALATGTFRPERNPELLLLISDQFFLTLVGVAFIFSLNLVSIGIAALADRREKPVFPRWFGYANLFMALLFAPGIFVYAFHDGPLAWNGLFALWIPACTFPVWKIMMIVGLLRAVKSEEAEEAAALQAAA
ncbi:hypothetical protein [Pararhizobium polonicum]|uniref:hypothetical protein n=1 Tax=Pararhizobium polonicum TaxID=1612624 RepID=UPI000AACB66B|nr:hypothetical protein [Pararhizobium polonicum]